MNFYCKPPADIATPRTKSIIPIRLQTIQREASPFFAAGFVTGHAMVVDGGQTAGI